MLTVLPQALSTYAGDIDGVMGFIYLIVGVWFVVAEIVLFWFVLGSRKKAGVRAAWLPGDTARSNAWVLAPVGLVLMCDLAIESAGDRVWHKVKVDMPAHDIQVRITARQFSWLFTYAGTDRQLGTVDDFTSPELHVPVNKVVRFELESADVLHSFYVPELRLKQDAVPGRSISGWFEANATGNFEVACAEICGKNHTAMKGALVVDSEETFQSWFDSQGGQ